MPSKLLISTCSVLLLVLSFIPASQAALWDDLKKMVGSGDSEDAAEVVEQAVTLKAAVSEKKEVEPATTTGTVSQLLPLVTGQLGVTERQARGGLGAIFQASREVMAPQDFALVERYVPEMNQLISEAPATNQLLGGALQYAGVGKGGTAAANLATQFHDLGLGTEMISKYSDIAADYLKEQSPDVAGMFTNSIAGLLE